MTTFRPRTVVVPLAAVAVLVTACGSSSNSASTGQATSTTAASSTAASSTAASSSPATSSASTSIAQAVTIKVTNGHLTDAAGRTLYLWVADTGSTSTCTGACVGGWPPVESSGTPTAGTGVAAAKLTLRKRADGSSQVDYAGHPLYYFVGDKTAGATNGQGSNGFGAKWWEVDGAGAAISAAATTSSAGYGGGAYGN